MQVLYLDGGRQHHGSWLPARFAPISDVQALRWLVPDLAACDVFLCGPPPWMRTVRGTLTSAGVSGDRIHAEQFAW